jgi:hypothetical protein
MILKMFSQKTAKIGVFDSKQSLIMQKYDHNIRLWEKSYFPAENWRNSQEIVIITSTPGANPTI